MSKFISIILIVLPTMIYAQKDSNNLVIIKDTLLCVESCVTKNGDTIVNLNSLNNGIIKYQISKESNVIIAANGLELKEGAIIVVVIDTLLKKNFSFDIKTYASDKEWYENTIKVKYESGCIKLINVTSDKIEMATGFRKEGKIYVVISVSMILFFTIIFYLIYLERKVKKLEKILKNK